MIDDIVARAASQPFFTGFGTAHLRTLCQDAHATSYAAAERLFTEGGTADRFWLLESGSVALDLRVPGRGDQVVETLLPGTVLGWSWLDPPYRWQFGAVARTPLETIVFDAAAVRRRCAAAPAFGYAVLRLFVPVIAQRLHATRLRVLDLYASPAEAGRP
jgi:CRP/FNR family cyclic AMP-dependent transcriptional regulator